MAELASYLGHQWRALYFARDISGVNWLPSAPNGHSLTMANCIPDAERRTTCEGALFDGGAFSSIDCGVNHNASAKLWVSLRFKLDQAFDDTDTADQYLWSKRIDGDNELNIRLEQNDGTIHWRMTTATVARFEIVTVQDSWEAGVWYHVLASISDTAGIGRLKIDNGDPVLTADVNAAPNGGDEVIGAAELLTTVGIQGVIVDVFVGTDDLITTEEASLYGGSPPADTVNAYKLNEGSGAVAYDEGSGADDGALGTTVTWAWGGCRQPTASFAGIDQYAVSGDGVNILGDLSVVWFGKIGFDTNIVASNNYLASLVIDNSNLLLLGDTGLTNDIQWFVQGEGGTGDAVMCNQLESSNLAIDDYAVIIGTLKAATGDIAFYINGVLQEAKTGAGQLVNDGLGAQIYVGCEDSPSYYGASDVLLFGVINGAIDPLEAWILSRMLNYRKNTGILI